MGKRRVFVLLFALQLFCSISAAHNLEKRHSYQKRATTVRTKVLILGAGVAGITAAKTLQDNGINDFLILEAQDYIGGRFKQKSFAGVNIEEGANWIHYAEDEETVPLWSLKQKYNLRGIYTNYSDIIIRLVCSEVLLHKGP